jgi:hypothetical protein
VSRHNVVCALVGAAFGFLFCTCGFNSYDVIHRMLLLQYFYPFLVLGSAVITAMPLLWWLERRRWRTPLGGELALKRWPVERKHVLGSMVFGAGWAVTGACPGTISGMLGEGSILGFVTLGGFLGGMWLRDMVVERGITPMVPPVMEGVAEPMADPVRSGS